MSPDPILILGRMTLILILLHFFYVLTLKRLTFYKEIRLYFIFGLFLSLILPFISFEIISVVTDSGMPDWVNAIPALSTPVDPYGIRQTSPASSNSLNILLLAWLAGMLVLIVRFIIRMLSFLRLKQKAKPVRMQGMRVHHLQEAHAPFSFGRDIFVHSGTFQGEDFQKILLHEFVHVKQKHSLDMLLAELVTMINWYNPAAWSLKKAIRENLEYLTDDAILRQGVDAKSYQYLLLQATGTPRFSFASAFSFQSLKNRIIMMNSRKSHRLERFKFLLFIPMMAMVLFAFRTIQEESPVIIKPSEDQMVPVSKDTVPRKTSERRSFFSYNGFDEDSKIREIRMENNKAEVRLKDGTRENYNLNNEDEALEFQRKYGELMIPPAPPTPPVPPVAPIPPIPPVPPIAPIPPMPPINENVYAPPVPPVPPVPPMPPMPPVPPVPPAIEWDLPDEVTHFNINNDKVKIKYKNGDIETYDLNDPKEKEKFKEKYKLKNKD